MHERANQAVLHLPYSSCREAPASRPAKSAQSWQSILPVLTSSDSNTADQNNCHIVFLRGACRKDLNPITQRFNRALVNTAAMNCPEPGADPLTAELFSGL